MPICYVILGTPRSGTSCLGGVLARLGIDMGPEDIPANEMNPLGFYQDYELHRLLQEAAAEDEFIPETLTLSKVYRGKLSELIKRRCARNIDWGVKASRLPLVFDDFMKFCTHNVKLLITERDPELSVASMAEWINEAGQTARSIIMRSAQAIESILQKYDLPKFVVDYHDLVESPQQWVEKIATFCERDANKDAVEFITPDLLRHTRIRGHSEREEAKLLAGTIMEEDDRHELMEKLALIAIRHVKGNRIDVLNRLRDPDHKDWKSKWQLRSRE